MFQSKAPELPTGNQQEAQILFPMLGDGNTPSSSGWNQ